MHLQPSSSWYLFDVGDAPSVRLLTVEGRADPALSARPHARLAALAEAIHATAYHLTETELGSLRGQGSLRGRFGVRSCIDALKSHADTPGPCPARCALSSLEPSTT